MGELDCDGGLVTGRVLGKVSNQQFGDAGGKNRLTFLLIQMLCADCYMTTAILIVCLMS